MNKTHNLIYVGEKYYEQSKSMMSSLYEEGTLERWDWGFVNVALRKGEPVNIRPATELEIKMMDVELEARRRI